MFRSILSSFTRGYGRKMGSIAARRTSFLAVPLLVVVVVIGYLEITGGSSVVSQWFGPILHLVGR
jgi:hypothetical protein